MSSMVTVDRSERVVGEQVVGEQVVGEQVLDGLLAGLRDAVDRLAIGGDAEAWRLAGGEVVDALALVGRARHLLDVVEVDLVREGVTRGLPCESSWSPHDWVRRAQSRSAPAPAPGHVAQVLRLAAASITAGLLPPDPDEGDADDAVVDDPADGTPGAPRPAGRAQVCAAFADGVLSLASADQLVRFADHVGPVADPAALARDLGVLLHGARDEVLASGPDGRGPSLRHAGLTDRELRTAVDLAGRLLRPARDLDADDRRARSARSLTTSRGPAGMSSYRLVLDPEGAAVLDAAISALSAPAPEPDGTPDARPAAQRRADALVEVVRRGVSSPGSAPKSDKAQLLVTIPFDVLAGSAPGGGVTATGEVLSPGVVRRLACDAGIVPAVLGGPDEPLSLGRVTRYFTPGQKRALVLRDGGCTYPGCTVPAQWCDAHHVQWWSREGPTDLANAALLCARHHTTVHTLDLTATITGIGSSARVRWDP